MIAFPHRRQIVHIDIHGNVVGVVAVEMIDAWVPPRRERGHALRVLARPVRRISNACVITPLGMTLPPRQWNRRY